LRSPQRFGQLAIPPLPQITELLYLVWTLGSSIPRFSNIFGEIVKTRFRQIAQHRWIHVDEWAVASLHQLPIAFSYRHHAAEPPIQRVVRRACDAWRRIPLVEPAATATFFKKSPRFMDSRRRPS
jgi:hypothetical protein